MDEQGFDVVTYPGPSPYLLVRPITSYVDYPELHQELIEFATRALEEVRCICIFCVCLSNFFHLLIVEFLNSMNHSCRSNQDASFCILSG